MKAIIVERFGAPEVMQVKEVPTPEPKDHEVLVRNYAATVCKEDPMMRKAPPFNGIFKPKHPILGMYFAGRIEKCGKDVSRFKVGDEVYGSTGMKFGAYAEYLSIAADGALVRKPKGISFEAAAAIPNGALTTIPYLQEIAGIKESDKVLIIGASGTVGTSGIQIAKSVGAEVTGVCSTSKIDLAKSLGADHIIDYTVEDFKNQLVKYDIIFDAAGKSSFSKCKSLLKEGGIYLSTGPDPIAMLRSKIFGSKAKYRAGFAATGLRPVSKKVPVLEYTNELIDQGKYRAVIDRSYEPEEIQEAHVYVAEGRKSGDVVINFS